MWKYITQHYNNLPIRSKIFTALGLLLILGITQIIILLYATQSQNNAQEELVVIQTEIDLARSIQNHALTARNHETAVGLIFLQEGLSGIEEEVTNASIESQTASNLLTELKTSEESVSGEKAEALTVITLDLEEYQATVDIMVNEQIVERGDMESGLAGDVMTPLNIVHEQIDASATLTLVEIYIDNADPDVLFQIPSSIGALRTTIDEADIDEAEKERLKTEVQSAQTAFLALANHDLNILNNVTVITTLSDEIIANLDTYVELKLTEQSDARAKVDDVQQTYLYVQYASLSSVAMLALLLTYILAKSINDPLQKLTQTSNLIAEGNYTHRVQAERKDELGILALNFNRMIEAIAQRDTTLQSQAKQLQLAKEEAEETTRLKSEFLATMSHELRTPLNAIEGFSSIMLAGMGVTLSPEAEKMVERISANSQRLVELVNDVLDLSRIEAGRVEIKYDPVAVTDMVARWENEIRVVAEQKSLSFAYDVNKKLPGILLTDWEAINKIVLNLLTNSVKYTEAGSIYLALDSDKDNWIIKVTDTGIGISPEAQNYIFEEFRQVDGSSKRKYGGVGLGLSIVQKLVRLMEGQISVTSKLEEGSTFIVKLPLKAEIMQTQPE